MTVIDRTARATPARPRKPRNPLRTAVWSAIVAVFALSLYGIEIRWDRLLDLPQNLVRYAGLMFLPPDVSALGKAVSAGAWEVFLARGDKTYVARLNEVIDGTYRVDRIAPPLLMLTYLPLNQTQQVNIGVSD